jgi:hypothetical protein
VISPPADGNVALGIFVLLGTGEPATQVELFEDGVLRASLAANGATWGRLMSGVTPGTHQYTARATDAAGNVSAMSAPRVVRVGP